MTTGAFDAYANLLKGNTEKDLDKPVAKGEYQQRIAALSTDNRAKLGKSVTLFRALIKVLPEVRRTFKETQEEIKANTEVEVEKALRSILIGLRKGDVGSTLSDSIQLQLYNAYLWASDFEKAIDLYPPLRDYVGGRMNGIFVLSENLREVIRKHRMIEDYFKETTNSRGPLMTILADPIKPDPKMLDSLFHFGCLLPLFYLLSNCADVKEGICGNCSATSEDRVRAILGGSIKEGLLNRLCEFAKSFA
jgi:hypothetical protein